jgi:hypothetical protein
MKASELLREAVKLPWTQGSLARDHNNVACFPYHEEAVCFCSVGRIRKVTKMNCSGDIGINYLNRIINSNIFRWNDAPERTKEQVDAAFLAAAELAEKEGN